MLGSLIAVDNNCLVYSCASSTIILHIPGVYTSDPLVANCTPARSAPPLSDFPNIGDTFNDPNLRITSGYIFGVQWNDVVFCVEALIGGAPWSNGTSLSFRPSALLSTYSIYRYRPLPDAGIVHCPGMANGNCSPLFTGCSMMTSHPHFATATSSRVNTIVHISRAAFASGTITPRSFLMPSGVASASIEGGV